MTVSYNISNCATGSISIASSNSYHAPINWSSTPTISINYDIEKHKGHFVVLAMANYSSCGGASLGLDGVYYKPYCLDCKRFIETKDESLKEQDLTNGKGKEVFSKDEVKLENEELKGEI